MLQKDKILLAIWGLAVIAGLYTGAFIVEPSLLLLLGLFLLLTAVVGSALLGGIQRGALIALLSLTVLIVTSLLSSLLLGLKYLAGIEALGAVFSILPATAVFLYFVYPFFRQKKSFWKIFLEKKRELFAFYLFWIVVAGILHFTRVFSTFGAILLLSALVSAYGLFFLLPPAVRLYRLIELEQKLTEEEKRLRTYIKKYGKSREVLPFYASWLGVELKKINELIDSIEAKGWLGHNFFAIENPFYWLSVLVFILLGISTSGGISVKAVVATLLLALSAALFGPQKLFSSIFRKIWALFAFSLAIFLLRNEFLVKLSFASILLALVAIYFAYIDEEIFSAFFASAFMLGLFGINHFAVSAVRPPLLIPLTVALALFLVITEEAMREGPWERA